MKNLLIFYCFLITLTSTKLFAQNAEIDSFFKPNPKMQSDTFYVLSYNVSYINDGDFYLSTGGSCLFITKKPDTMYYTFVNNVLNYQWEKGVNDMYDWEPITYLYVSDIFHLNEIEINERTVFIKSEDNGRVSTKDNTSEYWFDVNTMKQLHKFDITEFDIFKLYSE